MKPLEVIPQEVALIQEVKTRQRKSPLWLDVRQWEVTVCNFRRICKRCRDPGLYPLSLTKLCLGDYGSVVPAMLTPTHQT